MNDTPPRRSASPSRRDSKTITIKPVHFLAVLLAVGVFGIAFFVSRARAASQAATAMPTQAASQAASAPGANIQVVPSDSQVLSTGSSELYPGQVIPSEGGSPMLGKPYIDIEGTNLDGERVAVKDLIGTPFMLNFWATWCPPCRVEMPWLQEAYDTYKDQGFTILAVDAGEKVSSDLALPTVTSFIQSSGFTFPIMMPDDPYTPQLQYSVYGLPSTYMIGKDGVVHDAHRGMFPNRATINARVEELLGTASSAEG